MSAVTVDVDSGTGTRQALCAWVIVSFTGWVFSGGHPAVWWVFAGHLFAWLFACAYASTTCIVVAVSRRRGGW